MSKRYRERESKSANYELEFVYALEEAEGRKASDPGRRMEHKSRQLCEQARRVLNLVLSADSVNSALEGAYVSEVLPGAGAGNLIVHVELPPGTSSLMAERELRERATQLRAAVAAYICRKRAPELSFVVAPSQGAYHG